MSQEQRRPVCILGELQYNLSLDPGLGGVPDLRGRAATSGGPEVMVNQRPNLPALFLAAVRQHPRAELLGGRRVDGWKWWSSSEVLQAAREIAAGLIAQGLNAGERVGILSENRPEWLITDLAVQFAAAVDVPVYPTLPAAQAAFLLQDSGARFLILSGAEQARKLAQVRRELPGLQRAFCMEGAADGVMSLDELRSIGRGRLERNPGGLEERLAELGSDDLATIIYTSGTTGVPKGAMLSHRNFCHNVAACVHLFEWVEGDVALSFLPLSHVLERMVSYAYLEMGLSIGFIRGPEQLRDALGELRPHVFCTVPKVLEMAAGRIKEAIEGRSPLARTVGHKAMGWADAAADDFISGRRPGGLRGLRWKIADKLVLSKLRDRLGGRLKFMICGGAALSPDIARFFWAAGIPVYEGYGMTETAPVLTVNHPGAVTIGSVGEPIPEVELRVAADGEVLARGPNVMKGYWNRPVETEQALAGDWMHTGDVGFFDGDGRLHLTGRKKEILVLSTGKNVAPRAVEESLERSPFISRVIAVGDERPTVGVLIVPDVDRVLAWAAERRMPTEDLDVLLSSSEVRQLYQGEIQRLQAKLAVFEKARRFEFLLDQPTEENGLLTPTQKLRRHAVMQRYGELVDRMYK